VLSWLETLLKPAGGQKQGRISPSYKDHVWMGAVKKDVLLILYRISVAQVTSRGGIVSHSYNSWGVGTKSEVCQAANNVTRKIKEHAFGKAVRHLHNHGLVLA